MKKQLTIGILTTMSGKWPYEIPKERTKKYGDFLEKQFPEARIVRLPNYVLSDADIENAAETFRKEGADVAILVPGTFTGDFAVTRLAEVVKAPIILWIPYEPPFDPNTRLLSNAMVSAVMNSAALHRLNMKYHFVYGGLDDEKAVNELCDYIKVYDAVKQLRGTLFGLYGYRPAGFYSSNFNEALIRETFGIRFEATDMSALFDRMALLDPALVLEDATKIKNQYKIVNLPEGYLEENSKLYLALKEHIRDMNYKLASIKCLPELGSHHIQPCGVIGRLADDGIIVGCEGDVDATITMLAQNLLSGGIPFMADPLSANSDDNSMVYWHCGQAAPSLKLPEEEILLSNHSMAGQGTAFYTSLKSGPVTVARFTNIDNKYKLFVYSAEAVPTERFTKGVVVKIRLQTSARELVYKMVENGIPHHVSIVWEDIGKRLMILAKALGIEVIKT